ncbi:GmrSD restriction endonuclease domain-containing protein [Kaistella pullorum]|uniref:DUF262 domain-containing protein n=1 Tax=Kaistella pullorum TaxID=2763074 RepID=A0ABR8WJ31_9FLAO|nr:DUF262 domain-containing protein [Kaistella pullorum]MBD8017078.1 DUF262 domain-containing protein [Kaistella pullorum]
MEIKLHEITIRELTAGYDDKGDDGVTAYGGKLDVRPPFQREFVYDDKQRAMVIDTVMKGHPLNVMYWAVRDASAGSATHYEIIDGQQRTISICQYVANDYSVKVRGNMLAYENLQDDEQQKILDYKLLIYICEGTPSEKLEWFETINIAGAVLTKQELRNASYAGPWLSDAKKYFSKPNGPAFNRGHNLLSGSAKRQDYLETILTWISKGNIEKYMGDHQHDANANALKQYFEAIITWQKNTYKNYRSSMKGIDWGALYDTYKDAVLDTDLIEKQIAELVEDDEVKSEKGIYKYVLTGDWRYLDLRTFDVKTKRKKYQQQEGICPVCQKHYEFEEMEGDHIIPWKDGGLTVEDNLMMLCKNDNRRKSGK